MISGYPKVYNLGHRAISELLHGPTLVVQEKIDGSQFSCMRKDGVYQCRSKGTSFEPESPGMFDYAVANTQALDLRDGWVYRFEYLRKSKHNTLCYDRVPRGNVILFDVETQPGQHFLNPGALLREGERLGVETVPLVAVYGPTNDPPTYRDFDGWIKSTSILGGQQVEGIVLKNYDRFGADGDVLMGKHVREDFKEANHAAWTKNKGSALDRLVARYRTEPRWQKAVQHLRESGRLLNEPKDIGSLILEVKKDLLEECEDEIKKFLFQEFQKDLLRGVCAGLPEWYKDQLARKQFDNEVASETMPVAPL